MDLREHEASAETHCPYCKGDRGGEEWRCPSCETVHHLDCARENGRCTVLGCEEPVADAVAALNLTVRVNERSFTWRLARLPGARGVLLASGLAIVLAFSAKWSELRGDSLLDPVVVCLFFVGVTLWGTIYDRLHAARRAPRGNS